MVACNVEYAVLLEQVKARIFSKFTRSLTLCAFCLTPHSAQRVLENTTLFPRSKLICDIPLPVLSFFKVIACIALRFLVLGRKVHELSNVLTMVSYLIYVLTDLYRALFDAELVMLNTETLLHCFLTRYPVHGPWLSLSSRAAKPL